MSAPLPAIRVGLPYLTHGSGGHPLLDVVRSFGSPVMLSAGSLYRPGKGFQRAPLSVWHLSPALDSSGFVAMSRFGGYRWTVAEYVERIVCRFGSVEDPVHEPIRCAMPHPWAWWSAPDYCCEREVAGDAAEVQRRVDLTAEGLADTLAELNQWRDEGDTDTPDPMPILQGWRPDDYLRSAELLSRVVVEHERCTCWRDPEGCEATLHREGPPALPELVGVGSVCRRQVHGRDGLLSVLEALDDALPGHVRLHLFGVKGEALSDLGPFVHRVASVDSMAWDKAASVEANKTGQSCTLDLRARHLRAWLETNHRRRDALTHATRGRQLRLW